MGASQGVWLSSDADGGTHTETRTARLRSGPTAARKLRYGRCSCFREGGSPNRCDQLRCREVASTVTASQARHHGGLRPRIETDLSPPQRHAKKMPHMIDLRGELPPKDDERAGPTPLLLEGKGDTVQPALQSAALIIAHTRAQNCLLPKVPNGLKCPRSEFANL